MYNNFTSNSFTEIEKILAFLFFQVCYFSENLFSYFVKYIWIKNELLLNFITEPN